MSCSRRSNALIVALFLVGSLAALGTLSAPATPRPDVARGGMHALSPAIVVDTQDPEALGRVKVQFAWDRSAEDGVWARLVVGFRSDTGAFTLPEVNDEVLVAFEHGDVGDAYVLGGLWNGEAR